MNLAENTLDFEQVRVLIPLRQGIIWLENLKIDGGALHSIVVGGNYDDASIDRCIDYIESGDYLNYLKSVNEKPKKIASQLEIVKGLKYLDEPAREMVCNGSTMTEELFNCLVAPPAIKVPQSRIILPS